MIDRLRDLGRVWYIFYYVSCLVESSFFIASRSNLRTFHIGTARSNYQPRQLLEVMIAALIADLSDVPVQQYGLGGTRDAGQRDGEGGFWH